MTQLLQKRAAKPSGKKDPGVPQLSHFKVRVKKEAALKQKRVSLRRGRDAQGNRGSTGFWN